MSNCIRITKNGLVLNKTELKKAQDNKPECIVCGHKGNPNFFGKCPECNGIMRR